uniref:CST complex subunit STN1 n=1 Tax=Chelonoidis abingdonii TaxID=106734 RepID=A0A8C0H3I4_CHEAB
GPEPCHLGLNQLSIMRPPIMPSLLWGLNPVFSAFARLYIKDIKEMKESKQVPGIFFYNGHPIRQVDVVGTVVLRKERDAFYNYGVDDSSGVINCICWKNPREAEKPLSATSCSSDLVEQMKKLQEEMLQKTKLEIGDIVKVRGHIRIYREQREIQASIYYKVDDPMCEVQISRMLELPCLYREVYDKPFKIPEDKAMNPPFQCAPGGLNLRSSIDLLSEKVKDFLQENRIETFYQQELETVDDLVSLASQPVSRTDSQQMDSKSEPSSKLIHSAFKEAIKVLQEKGVVFQKSNSPKDVYHATGNLSWSFPPLLHFTFVSADAEKGCHFLHILCCVRQSYSPYLSEMVMHHVLNLLERNSDIVSTMEGYYTAF